VLVTPYNERIVYTRVGRPKYRLQGYRWRSFMFDTPSPINQLRNPLSNRSDQLGYALLRSLRLKMLLGSALSNSTIVKSPVVD
jgi:hypothetical protein